MVRFHSFEARTKFLQYTARNSTKAWKNETTYKDFLKISPQMPRWQRRMESPIHTLMNCINKFEPLKSTTLKPYWKSLMIFAGPEGSKDSPQTIAPGEFLGKVDYVKYEEHPMGFRCDMYINEKLHSTVEPVFQDLWINQLKYQWDASNLEQKAGQDVEASSTASTATPAKPVLHWTRTPDMLTKDFDDEFPWPMQWIVVTGDDIKTFTPEFAVNLSDYTKEIIHRVSTEMKGKAQAKDSGMPQAS